jgi:transketolase
MQSKVSKELQEKAINTLRFLSADGVQQANSGHPGLPMGTAAIAYTIWTRHLHHNPQNPKWVNRDRFILSGGHGSMLLYSLLHLTGYDLSLDELKHFRQWGSHTPGHPEVGITPGIETTTGPLGQGFSNGVGMAVAEEHMAAVYNRPGYPIFDHYIYAIVTDGDLMEGVASEAASFAGHQQLGRLIYCYDDNHISIDGPTDISFSEDRAMRFEAYGWQVLTVKDGNDAEEIDRAIIAAKQDPRPSIIMCRTHIGFGLPTRQDTSKAHGEPPGDEELNGAKEKLGWPLEPRFYIPEDVLDLYRSAVADGTRREKEWNEQFTRYQKAEPVLAKELSRRIRKELPEDWTKSLPVFPTDPKGMATRAASGKVINAVAGILPELVGGSADLTPSNNTWIQESKAFQPESRSGRYFHFGVREHGMGAIVNGMALYGELIPYGATFLVFSDYMRGALRVGAFSHIPSIWIYTHDSIGLGEDGPTHQPVEHLAALRAIPNMLVLRPADANETVEAWRIAIERKDGPTVLALTRQACPTVDRSIYAPASGVRKGAYILYEPEDKKPEVILMASGSEVQIVLDAAMILKEKGVAARVVSFPSWELFKAQDAAYRNSVLPRDIPQRVAVEAGVSLGWREWVGDRGSMITLDHFGASAPYKELYQHFGITKEAVVEKVMQNR